MKILIDLTELTDRPTGIPRVTENIARSMMKCFPEHEYVLIFYKQVSPSLAEEAAQNNVETIVLKENRKLMRLITLPAAMRKSDADWLICPAHPSPLLLNDKRAVSVIHDLVPWKCPETMLLKSMVKWRVLISHAVKTNRYVLHVSNTVKQEVEEKFHNHNSVAVCNGVDVPGEADNSVLEKYGLEKGRYILSVATLEPRKNLKVLLEAFSKMEDHKGVKLVLSGGAGWKLKDAIGDLVEQKDLILTGYVSDAELNGLYQNAKLFVSSSIYEGFGLPVIEAINNDVPVLISDIPVYREITGGFAEYFPCRDSDALKDSLNCCMEKDIRTTKAYEQLREHVKQYTWENYVHKLNQLLTK